jgi:4-hydroxy-3-methylbut-2-enyl diphosphate reductase
VVFDMGEARRICDFIEHGGDAAEFGGSFLPCDVSRFRFRAGSAAVGLANQTTMLSGESLAIAGEVRQSMLRRYGEANVAEHFRTFDTICSATQERQDAMLTLLNEPLDLMIVVGGYNSSNTTHLAAMSRNRGVRTYHIEDASAIDVENGRMRYQPNVKQPEQVADDWLGAARLIGVTAGASTPNNKIGEPSCGFALSPV